MKYFFFLIVAFCFGCQKSSQHHEAFPPNSNKLILEYASGFAVTYHDDQTKLVEVLYPFQGATSGYKYLLVPKGLDVPEHSSDVRVISIPLSSIVCTSTTHIPLLDYLDQNDKLDGFTSSDLISTQKARLRSNAGHGQELGIDKGMQHERIAMLNHDVVMEYLMN